jgi:hypothetical protein
VQWANTAASLRGATHARVTGTCARCGFASRHEGLDEITVPVTLHAQVTNPAVGGSASWDDQVPVVSANGSRVLDRSAWSC